jgi:hypothetical protein
MRYEKNHLQWPNAELTFFIVIYHSSLVKAAVNGLRICKWRSGVKKNASISSFFNGQRWTKCAVNILRSYLN